MNSPLFLCAEWKLRVTPKPQQFIVEGYRRMEDLDLEKYFDRGSHDKLMARPATGIRDHGLLKLILASLRR